MKHSLVLLIWLSSMRFLAQAPQTIPYQAVLRNSDGSIMANTAATITLKIHDITATGMVVYQETHATTTNAQGLVSLNVGGGTAVTNTFSGIQWGAGSKFLHVLMDTGSGLVDLGTQQMMSVPYALYAEEVNVRVSVTGDSLFIGEQVSIVPGVSAANPISMSNYGSALLPGNTTCLNEYIAVTGCVGQDSLLYHNQYYSLVEIGGQCWFAENLAATQFNDGSNIPTVSTGAAWGALSTPAYCWYNNNPSLINTYLNGKLGALYNAYAVATNNLCPVGWHVPSDCEWMYLENTLGLSVSEQMQQDWRGQNIALGGQLKDIGWTAPNLGATNSSGWSALPGGNRMGTASASFSGINNYGYWWTSTAYNAVSNWTRDAAYSLSSFDRSITQKRAGHSVRCLKD
jgi:uncharacterized protein (TIGR02145 family)